MFATFGIFERSSFWRKPSSTMPGTYSAVGAAMSYPEAPPWSLAISSSLLP